MWTKINKFLLLYCSVLLNRRSIFIFIFFFTPGTFTLGAKHSENEGPEPEEVLVAIKVNETKVAFKSGFNKYLRVEKDGKLRGISDAVGAMEQFEPIFQDGKLALLGSNSMFLRLVFNISKNILFFHGTQEKMQD